MFRNRLDLTSRICTFPFTQIELYEKDYICELSKQKDVIKYRKYYNKEFIQKVYLNLNLNNRINNLDEINLLFEKFYPRLELNKSKNIYEYYMNVLSKLSKSFICHRNGKIAFKYWVSEGEEEFIGPYSGINKIAFWNSLNRIFTTDLLVCKYLIDNEMYEERFLEGYYSTIMLEDIQLEQVLKKGVAETHIHRNASINFYISWQNIMDLTGKNKSFFKEELFSNEILGKKIGLQNYVQGIAICRLIMAYFLKTEANNITFDKYVFENYKKGNEWQNKNYKESNDWEKIYNLLQDIEEGNIIEEEKYEFSDLWNNILKEFNIDSNQDLGIEEIKKDILCNISNGDRYLSTSMENIFIFKCMKYIIYTDYNDEFFNKIFFQYVRIKNEVFQTKVQNNLIKGLINFKDYFKRSKQYKKIDKSFTDKEYWRLILGNQLQNKNLQKLEMRAGISSGSEEKIKKSTKKVLSSFLEAYRDILEEIEKKDERHIIPQIGLVFHLQKTTDKYESEKCWLNYIEGTNEYKELYFEEHRNIYMRQINALNEIREEIKGISDYIVGIDAASSENDTEPWVFAPIYDKARDSKKNKLFYNDDKNSRIKTLGFTFHVGEDFRHLLTGLRRIDEVITHFKFHAGDRIGHGIALGINVKKWANNNKVIILPRIEYLENLLWVWGIYKDGYYNNSFDILYLEQEIMKQAESIYQVIDGITVYNLWKAYRNKFKNFNVNRDLVSGNKYNQNRECLLLCKFANYEKSMFWNEEKLSHAQHCKCYLERMLEPIQVEIKNYDIKMIEQIQKIVCRKVSTQAIVVETNPSSNVAIGEVESIFEHYIYNLNNRGLNEDSGIENSIIISINSDDPSVFNTNISNEFSYIFYSLQEKGYSREDILSWIDKIRQYGMDSSFIENRYTNISEIRDLIKEVDEIIEKLKS